jgi:hypothetical protein
MTVIKNDKTLSPGIDIISYNYDRQIEKSLRTILRNPDHYGFNDINEKILGGEVYNKEKLNIVRVNGQAGKLYNNTSEKISNIRYKSNNEFYKETHNFLSYINDSYKTFIDNISSESLLKFSWELNDDYLQKLLNETRKISKYCEQLIVIGYSFPHFNQPVDYAIFYHIDIERIGKFKIVIQDLGLENCKYVESRISVILQKVIQQKKTGDRNIEEFFDIILEPNVNTFYIPPEFDIEY